MVAQSSSIPERLPLRRARHTRARLDELIEFAPEGGSLEDLVFWFARLVAWVRPRRGEDARARVRFLRARIEATPESRLRVATTLAALVQNADVEVFLTYGGVPRELHFLGAIAQWITARVLPAACRTDDVERIVCLALLASDLRWLRSSELASLLTELLPAAAAARFHEGAREASRDLVHEIVAQTHTPGIRRLDAGARSPFRGLYDAVATFLASPDDRAAFEALRGRIAQCQRAREAFRVSLAKHGADLNTTFQLIRVERQLERLHVLVGALHEGPRAAPRVAVLLVRSALVNARAAHLVKRSGELVVRNLVDTTADVGDDYLEEETSSFRAAFVAGMGGGLLMVLATIAKLGLHSLHLPTMYEGILFSLNYAAAFCAAYVLHFTIATKLPAHTAAALARSVAADVSRREKVAAFRRVSRALIRLQFGGLLGNLVIAGPLAFGIAHLVRVITHHPLIAEERAAEALGANSVLGPSAFYALLTGIFLWMSSLVGAAVDNWAKVNHLGAALATGLPVMGSIGVAKAEPAARAVEGRIGGFAGNAFLGFLLGAVPAAFAIARLPVEIRHVTVSASSVAIAAEVAAGRTSAIVLAVVGVLVIGLVNVVVSFALALDLALRASEDSGASRVLLRVGMRRLLGRGPRGPKTEAR